MIDANEAEKAAMAAAGDTAGEFIEWLKRTDMAQWTPEEWRQFIEVVCGAYVDALVAAQFAATEALAKVKAA